MGSLLSLRGYHFDVELELTPTSLVLLVLDFLLCALVGAYSARYLHRDRGFFRFYLLLVLFAVIQNLRGKVAEIPTVSEAVRMQLF